MRTTVSTKDVRLAFHAEQVLESVLKNAGELYHTSVSVSQPRSFAELDVLFERKISARKFASTEVDVFEEEVDRDVVGMLKGGAIYE